MSFELKSNADNSEFSFSGTGWTFCLMLAEQFGWISEGTKKPKGFGLFKKWPGNYDSNEGQIVTSSDANNLADSIEAALGSDSLVEQTKKVASLIEDGVKQALGELPAGYSVQFDIDEEFKSYYEKFLIFCRKGAFQIK